MSIDRIRAGSITGSGTDQMLILSRREGETVKNDVMAALLRSKELERAIWGKEYVTGNMRPNMKFVEIHFEETREEQGDDGAEFFTDKVRTHRYHEGRFSMEVARSGDYDYERPKHIFAPHIEVYLRDSPIKVSNFYNNGLITVEILAETSFNVTEDVLVNLSKAGYVISLFEKELAPEIDDKRRKRLEVDHKSGLVHATVYEHRTQGHVSIGRLNYSQPLSDNEVRLMGDLLETLLANTSSMSQVEQQRRLLIEKRD